MAVRPQEDGPVKDCGSSNDRPFNLILRELLATSPRVSSALHRLVVDLLSPHPDDRPSSAEIVIDVLRQEQRRFKGVTRARALPVARLPGFADGAVSVQDAAAQLAAPLLDVQPGMRVLDACAAPGGKTTHLLEIAELDLTALDNDAMRLTRVRQNLERLRLNARLLAADINDTQAWWDGKPFARILADVPCSASGIVRRHADIKWLRRAADIPQFVSRQKRLLDSLWRLLASGGKLLYTTCSIFQEENSLQIADFLARHVDARPLPLCGVTTLDGTPEGQLLPDNEHDGFYYALLQKI